MTNQKNDEKCPNDIGISPRLAINSLHFITIVAGAFYMCAYQEHRNYNKQKESVGVSAENRATVRIQHIQT